MPQQSDLVQALRPVLAALARLQVRYYIGGSVASSYHGAARSTLDVDVVTELDRDTAQKLIEALQGEYYISATAVQDAVRRRSCFNAIHLATCMKVDVFISKGRDFDRRAMARAIADDLGGTPSVVVRIASAEDVIVSKLEWYRLGGETSERQWDDVTRVAMLQGDQLDWNYLRLSASEIGVEHLLVRLESALGKTQ